MDKSLHRYGLELITKFVYAVDYEITENNYKEFDIVDGERSSHHQLLLKLIPSKDADEVEKESPKFSREILSVMYALSALSFEGARPRGISDMHFNKDDQWNIGEFLLFVEFSNGQINAHYDYISGRALKTMLQADSKNWTIKIITNDRGRSAEHWIRALKGKSKPELVSTQPSS